MGDDVRAHEPLLSNRTDYGTNGDANASGNYVPAVAGDTDSSKGSIDSEAQNGVQQADAVTLVWTRSALILAYAFIFLNFCSMSMEQQTTLNLLPFVVSDFSAHSLIPAIGIASFILSGVLRLPVAKMIDTWGRPQGLAAMTVMATLGLVLMAACNSATTYAAAQVLRVVGFSGFSFILEIIIADTSSLKDRALAFACTGSPAIATNLLGPPAAQWFLHHSSWRTAFALFAVLTPLVALPVFGILESNTRKARRLGILKSSKSGRSWSQALCYYAVEFDAVGVFLVGGGLTLILLPFSIAGSSTSKWSPGIFLMLVLGSTLTVSFVLFEYYCAPKPFVPFQLLCSRNVMGSFILSVVLFIAYYCWDGYFTSYLQVVHQLSVYQAGYVANTYIIVGGLWAFVAGWLIRFSDRFKWLALFAVPVLILSGVLMVLFRQPSTPIFLVVLPQIVQAFGGSTLVVTEQMAVMSVAKHGEVASLIALLGLSTAIGSGIGNSVSGAIWTNTVYTELLRLLPDDARDRAEEIYENLHVQLSYHMGSPVREAIIQAYAIAQRRMLLAGLCILLIAIPAVAMWRDVRVSQFRQVKGRVL
ncbi:Siderophore iron transporter mirB [Cytospora mali]|uniref:Siderophore iron transporter mirB n=1 Tax=Cytospora mali TaxID=578113 RepID=A0A194V328_CYTMA|nr:Siderophore iron transporter mirB [Valsa mali var. pyri (nom. inval.)]